MAEPARLHRLNQRDYEHGDYVLYWMQQAQRADFNPALDYAIEIANDLAQPVVVGFGLMDDYPEANERHYAFMLEGLRETATALRERGIRFVMQRGSPPDVALALGEPASAVICDRGYLRHQMRWRSDVGKRARCCAIQVETDVIVPIEAVSEKHEPAARTIRPKIEKRLAEYLHKPRPVRARTDSLGLKFDSLDLANVDRALAALKIDRGVPRSRYFSGGASPARDRLRGFLASQFGDYADGRSDPGLDIGSHLSPYLHFGQISPLEIALAANAIKGDADSKRSFLEELIVRRDLSMNFTHFTPDYDAYSCLPAWAQATLREHRRDKREHLYDRAELECAESHDRYWNAAMREMQLTGYMHNYMRMYWGKKILEWSAKPEQAFETALYLNNKYFIDGRDPNSCANIAWLFGLHDRPFPERPIYGKVRSMMASGLERKFDMETYVERIARLPQEGYQAEGE